jgi:preprotein translocase subunit SecE
VADANQVDDPDDFGADEAGDITRAPTPEIAQHHQSAPARLIGFLQGSWRELQRVQWPDRRQVMQATGVVLGFVVVAGIFLGVSDLVASKLMNLVLK